MSKLDELLERSRRQKEERDRQMEERQRHRALAADAPPRQNPESGQHETHPSYQSAINANNAANAFRNRKPQGQSIEVLPTEKSGEPKSMPAGIYPVAQSEKKAPPAFRPMNGRKPQKLGDAEKRVVLEMRKKGASLREIAKIFHVDKMTIKRIIDAGKCIKSQRQSK